MNGQKNINSDWCRCVDFHGHECPGLAIGFRAAREGMKWIAANRSQDEEIVAVVENDACGVDAVQVLTGCTFGKGNLVHMDHGKQVFTFFNRDRQCGVRISKRADSNLIGDRYRELMLRVRDKRATREEHEEMNITRRRIISTILGMSREALFAVTEPDIAVPEKARVQASELCQCCGEPVMPLKIVESEGRRLCIPCMKSRS